MGRPLSPAWSPGYPSRRTAGTKLKGRSTGCTTEICDRRRLRFKWYKRCSALRKRRRKGNGRPLYKERQWWEDEENGIQEGDSCYGYYLVNVSVCRRLKLRSDLCNVKSIYKKIDPKNRFLKDLIAHHYCKHQLNIASIHLHSGGARGGPRPALKLTKPLACLLILIFTSDSTKKNKCFKLFILHEITNANV